MLVNKTVIELLDAFAAPTPTPGGGSAAALAGAMAASLLEMVAAMPKTKSGTPEERAALDAALPTIKELRTALTALVDRDSESYDAVVAAYKLPKATEEEKAARKQAVRDAMRFATDVPMETARASAGVVVLGRTVAENGNPNASSDIGVAIGLAKSAFAGARENVAVNLDSTGDAAYAARVRGEIEQLAQRLSANAVEQAAPLDVADGLAD